MAAIGYVKQGDREQREIIQNYAIRAGLDLVDIIDGNLSTALALLKKRSIDSLIVPSLDCFSVNAGDFSGMVDKHFKKNRLVIIRDNLSTATASDRLSMNLIMSMKQYESEVLEGV